MNPILFSRTHFGRHEEQKSRHGADKSGLGKLIVAATGILLVSAIGILLTAPSQSDRGAEGSHHVISH